MRLTEVNFGTAQPVDGYGPGFFRIGGQVVKGGALVSPWSVMSWSGFDDQEPLLALKGRIDVLLLGCGREISAIPADFRRRIESETMGLDVMSSPAACRTFNVLLGEGRRIAAALLPVMD